MKKIYTLITLIIFLLICINYSFGFQEKTPNTQTIPPDTAQALDADEEDYVFIDLVKEGNLFLQHKLYDDAIKKYEEANKIKESSNAYKGLGLAYIQKANEFGRALTTPYRALKKIDNFESSVNNFLKALSFEPNSLEIRYYLADAFVFRNNEETYQLAETLLKQVINTDRSYKNALVLLSIVYRNLGRYEESRLALNEYLRIKEADPKALYQLTVLAIDEDNLREAEKYFIMSLDNLTDEEAISNIVEDLEILFSEKDNAEFERAQHKGKFLKKFWMEKDPDPETKVNERLIEHFRRIKFAKKHFTTSSLHGRYDDRGRTYIKYGPPDNKYASGGDLNVYSNESWIYYWQIGEYDEGMYFDFANKGGKGFVLLGDLREAAYGEKMMDMDVYRSLFSERAYLDEKHYGRVARSRDDIWFMNEIIDHRDRKEDMYANIPEEAFLFYMDARPLNIMTSSASFRGKDGKTRHELYYSFELKNLKFKETDNVKSSQFDEFIILKNLDHERIYQDSRSFNLEYNKSKNLKNDSYIGQVNIEIPSMKEDFIGYLRIKSSESERLGLAYHELLDKSFTGSYLMMSDIEFSYDIKPTDEEDEYTKNGLRIIPHTGAILNKDEDVFIYFEVYNLSLDSDGDGRYTIEYIVQKRNPNDEEKEKYFNDLGKEVVNKSARKEESITITRTEITRQRDNFNWLTIEMKGLSEGLYDLTIKITDLVYQESTSSEYSFVLGRK